MPTHTQSAVIYEPSSTARAPDVETPRDAKRRVSRRGPSNLLFMLVPAVLFPCCLLIVRQNPRFAFLSHPSQYPWELWTIALFGTAATIGGTLDWLFHRSGLTAVGQREHLSHRAALAGGGIPLFLLMAAASVAAHPERLLLPIVIVVIFTTTMICYDEFLFHHKRCERFETITHRLLVFGNAIAFLAWMHWCFVRNVAATHA